MHCKGTKNMEKASFFHFLVAETEKVVLLQPQKTNQSNYQPLKEGSVLK